MFQLVFFFPIFCWFAWVCKSRICSELPHHFQHVHFQYLNYEFMFFLNCIWFDIVQCLLDMLLQTTSGGFSISLNNSVFMFKSNTRDTLSTMKCPRTNSTQHQHLTEKIDSMEYVILSPCLGKPNIQSFVHGALMDEVAGFGFDSVGFLHQTAASLVDRSLYRPMKSTSCRLLMT